YLVAQAPAGIDPRDASTPAGPVVQDSRLNATHLEGVGYLLLPILPVHFCLSIIRRLPPVLPEILRGPCFRRKQGKPSGLSIPLHSSNLSDRAACQKPYTASWKQLPIWELPPSHRGQIDCAIPYTPGWF